MEKIAEKETGCRIQLEYESKKCVFENDSNFIGERLSIYLKDNVGCLILAALIAIFQMIFLHSWTLVLIPLIFIPVFLIESNLFNSLAIRTELKYSSVSKIQGNLFRNMMIAHTAFAVLSIFCIILIVLFFDPAFMFVAVLFISNEIYWADTYITVIKQYMRFNYNQNTKK